jgi:peptide/nickel transport system permease protein
VVRYVAKRALQAIPVLIGISVVSFFLIRLVPGDPIRTLLGPRASADAVALLRVRYGLDLPIPLQYANFLAGIARLDLGDSITYHRSVVELIGARIGPTVVLIAYATLVSFVVAVPLATYAAIRANRLPDQAIRFVMMVTFAMPAFWLGLVLILGLSLNLHLFPASGIGSDPISMIWSLTLPAFTIGLYLAPVFIRSLRAGMIESLHADYVDAARARGLSEATVIRRHVLRTSLIATVTIVGVNLGFLISGTVVVENVFAIPGVGSLLVTSVTRRDFPLIQGLSLLLGFAVVVVSLATDVINTFVDPRIRR